MILCVSKVLQKTVIKKQNALFEPTICRISNQYVLGHMPYFYSYLGMDHLIFSGGGAGLVFFSKKIVYFPTGVKIK